MPDPFNIAYDPVYCHPLPEGHRFPMLKYELIPAQLLREGTVHPTAFFSPGAATDESILLTHSPEYWQRLKNLQLSPAEIRRSGFPLSARLVEREVRIAQGSIDGAVSALEKGIAFNVAGGTHHAGTNWAEGFCLLNDQAIAANYLLHHGLAENVLIIDLDVHQGNGTAEIFAGNDRVFTFSMHAGNNFPFRKELSSLDVGLPDGIEDEEYLGILEHRLDELFRSKPAFVFYLSGVDVLGTDKLGKLKLSRAGCRRRDELVLERCRGLNVPVQVSMGGGYSERIYDIVEAHCNTFRVANELYG